MNEGRRDTLFHLTDVITQSQWVSSPIVVFWK